MWRCWVAATTCMHSAAASWGCPASRSAPASCIRHAHSGVNWSLRDSAVRMVAMAPSGSWSKRWTWAAITSA